jgi:branched-chain amino acid transport system substrate-binding protein
MKGSSSWLVALLICGLVCGCKARMSPEPIYVGHLAPLSGTDWRAGVHARQGVQLAIDGEQAGHQEAGGRPIVVVHVDTRGDPDQAQAETVRLLTVNKALILLAGPEIIPIERIIRANQPYGAPLVIAGELPGSVAAAGVRAFGASPEARGKALADYACRDLKAKKAILLSDSRDSVATALAAAFQHQWRSREQLPCEEWTFASKAEAPSLASRAVKAKPDIVMIASATQEFQTLETALCDAGYRGPLIYGGQDTGPVIGGVESCGDVYLASVFAVEKWTARGREFARRYEATFHEPPDLFAAQAYDGACLVATILQKVEKITLATLRDELVRTDSFESVTGPMVWKDLYPRRPLYIHQVKGGKDRVVEILDPE